MATSEQILDIERSFIGNIGGLLFQDWYGFRGAWCAMFQSYCFDAAGIPLQASSEKGFAWVSSGFTWMRNQGWNSFDVYKDVRPGSLLAFEWGSTPNGYDHIGICESVTDTGMVTIEGNVGNRVQRLFRSFENGGVVEVANPPYDNATITPTIHRKDKTDMFKLKNVDGREERFTVWQDGRVLVQYQFKPGGVYSSWEELRPGMAATGLYASQAGDGRLCVEVTDSVYGAVYGSWQTAPGAGPWCDWFLVDDMIKFLGG